MGDDFTQILEEFSQRQVEDWPLAKENYAGLEKVQTKTLMVDGLAFKVQFNPERVRSTTAKVDAASIQNRACFLCSNHRPNEQTALKIGKEFEILVNPFPIFQQHFTVPLLEHTPQLIGNALDAFLEISQKMKGFTVFYNGPFCGASAPDHLHFQAIKNKEIPIFHWVSENGKTDFESPELHIQSHNKAGLNVLHFESATKKLLFKCIKTAIDLLDKKPEHAEPMFNLLCKYEAKKWKAILIPRQKHRPEMYFQEGKDHFAISPASVDLGGVFVLPFQKDFERISSEVIAKTLSEVCYSKEMTVEFLKRYIPKLEEIIVC